MSITRIASEKVLIENSATNVFNYLSNFNNFKQLMPEQVTDWKSTEEECSFNINGMAVIGMKIIDKTPVSAIHIVSHGKVPFEFKLDVLLEEAGDNKTYGQLVFQSELNMMIKMMVEKPLTAFFNVLAQKMKDIK